MDFIKAGHEVRCWRRSYDDFSSSAKGGYLRLLDHTGQQVRKVHLVTKNIGNAVENAELIV